MTAVAPERAEVELGKFLTLVGEGVDNLTMASQYVDEVWHAKLDDPEAYAAFCATTAGTYVSHEPGNGEGTIEWTSEYERRFGKLDDVWFMDKEGNLDKTALADYRDLGEFRGSWDCVPAGT